MGVSRQILIVDSSLAFAMMLKEMLEVNGDCQATVVASGSDALQAIVEQQFNLVIVDMGINDIPPVTMIKAIREARPTMRVMLIPLLGTDLPPEVRTLDIQGVLPKPFFVGELPAIIEAAFAAKVSPPASPPAPTAEARPAAQPSTVAAPAAEARPAAQPGIVAAPAAEARPAIQPAVAGAAPSPASPLAATLRGKVKEIDRLLADLNREVKAETILVTSGNELIAVGGLLNRERSQELALLVAEGAQAASRAAAFLGEPLGRFEQTLHEGSEFCLYSLNLAEGLVLSIALSSATPLGMIRYHARRTGAALLKLAGVS
jgi:CheY-like chemotaxis protein/predicted regulator of Ras-like GTPase activity (Roadblock/LC7/MglB family)